MDSKTLEQLGARVDKVVVPYAAKAWGGSRAAGGEWSVEVHVPPTADAEEVAEAAYLWLKQLAHKLMAEDMHEALSSPTVHEQAAAAARKVVGKKPAESVDAPEPEYQVMEVEYFIVNEQNEKRSAKLYGGSWKKYGVTAWPEVFSVHGIDLNELPLGEELNLGDGLGKARVLMIENKPKKAVELL